MRRSRSLGGVCAMSAPAGASMARAASAIEKDAKRRDMTIPDDGGLMTRDASTSACRSDPGLSTAGSAWTKGRARGRGETSNRKGLGMVCANRRGFPMGISGGPEILLGQAVGGDEPDRASLAGGLGAVE